VAAEILRRQPSVVVAYLTDALVELGHEVTLFASGDSLTKAKLAPIWPRALRLDPSVKDYFRAGVSWNWNGGAGAAHEFDVIHSHLDYFGYPLLQLLNVPSVTTLHGRLDLPEPAGPVRAIRGRSGWCRYPTRSGHPWRRRITWRRSLMACRRTCWRKGPGTGGYLAFLSAAFSPEKAPDGRDPYRRPSRHAAEDRRKNR